MNVSRSPRAMFRLLCHRYKLAQWPVHLCLCSIGRSGRMVVSFVCRYLKMGNRWQLSQSLLGLRNFAISHGIGRYISIVRRIEERATHIRAVWKSSGNDQAASLYRTFDLYHWIVQWSRYGTFDLYHWTVQWSLYRTFDLYHWTVQWSGCLTLRDFWSIPMNRALVMLQDF